MVRHIQYIQMLWTLDSLSVAQLLEGVYCHGFVCIVYKLDVAWRRISLLSTYFYQVYEDKRLWIVTASDTLGKGVS